MPSPSFTASATAAHSRGKGEGRSGQGGGGGGWHAGGAKVGGGGRPNQQGYGRGGNGVGPVTTAAPAAAAPVAQSRCRPIFEFVASIALFQSHLFRLASNVIGGLGSRDSVAESLEACLILLHPGPKMIRGDFGGVPTIGTR